MIKFRCQQCGKEIDEKYRYGICPHCGESHPECNGKGCKHISCGLRKIDKTLNRLVDVISSKNLSKNENLKTQNFIIFSLIITLFFAYLTLSAPTQTGIYWRDNFSDST